MGTPLNHSSWAAITAPPTGSPTQKYHGPPASRGKNPRQITPTAQPHLSASSSSFQPSFYQPQSATTATSTRPLLPLPYPHPTLHQSPTMPPTGSTTAVTKNPSALPSTTAYTTYNPYPPMSAAGAAAASLPTSPTTLTSAYPDYPDSSIPPDRLRYNTQAKLYKEPLPQSQPTFPQGPTMPPTSSITAVTQSLSALSITTPSTTVYNPYPPMRAAASLPTSPTTLTSAYPVPQSSPTIPPGRLHYNPEKKKYVDCKTNTSYELNANLMYDAKTDSIYDARIESPQMQAEIRRLAVEVYKYAKEHFFPQPIIEYDSEPILFSLRQIVKNLEIKCSTTDCLMGFPALQERRGISDSCRRSFEAILAFLLIPHFGTTDFKKPVGDVYTSDRLYHLS